MNGCVGVDISFAAIDNIRRDLAERPAGWLMKAAAMIKQVSDEEHKTFKVRLKFSSVVLLSLPS